jgi:predicted lipoprotein with Yx(FWY)xxD motif
MQRNRYIGLAVAGLLMAVAACSEKQQAENGVITDTSTAAAPTAPAAPESASTPATAPAVVGAAVTVANSPQYGSYLADGQGRALYLFTADKPGASSCTGACATAWPPYVAEQGAPGAGSAGVQASMLSSLQRPDGKTQVVYNQHPLYYFQKDTGPGQTTGEDIHAFGGEWYLVTPQGEKLEKGEGGGQS